MDKDVRVYSYLTPDQVALIDRAAELLDISRSQFLRAAAVEKAMKQNKDPDIWVTTAAVNES